jgi:hypothetical protein
MRLFHFSEQAGIGRFEPRPVRIPSARPPGREWLNGPLVWAIDEPHQPMYLFPRDCPRILLWPVERTTQADLDAWWRGCDRRMIAHMEDAWLEALETSRLYRYELPPSAFECLEDAGMWVSRTTVEPVGVDVIDNLPRALSDCGVELRVMQSLSPLRAAWSTTLHVSGIRLRNAQDWT